MVNFPWTKPQTILAGATVTCVPKLFGKGFIPGLAQLCPAGGSRMAGDQPLAKEFCEAGYWFGSFTDMVPVPTKYT